MSYSVTTARQLQDYLRAAGWPENLVVTMAAIGLAESSGNPNAVNWTSREHSVGLWQINLNAHPQYTDAQMRDPVQNARAALDIYNRQGLRAWGAYTDGRYVSNSQGRPLDTSQAAYSGAAPTPIDLPVLSDYELFDFGPLEEAFNSQPVVYGNSQPVVYGEFSDTPSSSSSIGIGAAVLLAAALYLILR